MVKITSPKGFGSNSTRFSSHRPFNPPTMVGLKLEVPCPKTANGISVDPQPDWTFDSLLKELNALESKLNSSSSVPVSFTKMKSRELFNVQKINERSPTTGAFIMRFHDDDYESDDDEDHSCCLVTSNRFACDDLYLSDSDDSDFDVQSGFMDKVGVVEGTLSELSRIQQSGVQEHIRNQISSLETDMMDLYEKSIQRTIQIEKYRDARLEMDKKLDTQYQRKIAEALDNHLTAVQRDHEHRSQIEGRRIRNDAAFENAKRKEKALQEEKRRQEKAIAEAEAMKKRGEEERKAALEAEKKAVEEAAKREAADVKTASEVRGDTTESQVGPSSGTSNSQSRGPESIATKKSQLAGNIFKAAESALNLEQGRLQKLNQLEETNHLLRSSSQNYRTYEKQIARWTKIITGTEESVRTSAEELFAIMNNTRCPQSISIATFAQKVVDQCKSPNYSAFAIGHVVVLLTSQVPHAMDIVLGQIHKVCIYTVPKHISYKKSVFESQEAYYKAIGYLEDDGKLETHDDYLKRLEAYIEMYGAIVQTQVQGVQNVHGLKEGWAWLSRFLNSLPANRHTGFALRAFLKMAGFALFRKYKSQFIKLMNAIAENFLIELKKVGQDQVASEIKSYIEDRKFLQEPEGRRLMSSSLSSHMDPHAHY